MQVAGRVELVRELVQHHVVPVGPVARAAQHAEEAGVSLEEFVAVAHDLNRYEPVVMSAEQDQVVEVGRAVG